jgi:hypothetical protein
MSGGRSTLYASDFNLEPSHLSAFLYCPESGPGLRSGESVESIFEETLRKTNGNKTAAAEMFGWKRTTLAAKLKSLRAVVG